METKLLSLHIILASLLRTRTLAHLLHAPGLQAPVLQRLLRVDAAALF